MPTVFATRTVLPVDPVSAVLPVSTVEPVFPVSIAVAMDSGVHSVNSVCLLQVTLGTLFPQFLMIVAVDTGNTVATVDTYLASIRH